MQTNHKQGGIHITQLFIIKTYKSWGIQTVCTPYTQIQGLSPTFNFATKMQIALYFNFFHDNTSLIIKPYAQKKSK